MSGPQAAWGGPVRLSCKRLPARDGEPFALTQAYFFSTLTMAVGACGPPPLL